MLILIALLLLGDGADPTSPPIGPDPDVTNDDNRLIGALVYRGGVGRRGGRG